jgi:hypothetical protein
VSRLWACDIGITKFNVSNPTGAMLLFIPPGAKVGLSGPGVKTMLIIDHLPNQAAIFSVGKFYNYLNTYIVKYLFYNP